MLGGCLSKRERGKKKGKKGGVEGFLKGLGNI